MEKGKLRIVSYNIHKGFSSGRKKFILKRIREALHSVHPDIILLQEVLGQHEIHQSKIEEWPLQPQFEYLAHELWPHFAYGKNAIYAHGHHGNAILSKYPFSFFENIDVSTNKFEKRGLLHGIVELPGRSKPLHVVCVHLGLFEAERIRQANGLCDRIESHVPHGEPLIIGGDFNDWRQRISKALGKKLEVQEAFKVTHGRHARSFPSWLPALCLDRIYFRGLKIEAAQCLSAPPWSELSDHAALVADLHLG